nr:uncharacterized protein LOC117280920 [Nicotiana tomentosiformis]
MKVNSEKCAFGVGYAKFLGFLVLQRGIEVNPDKIKAIEDIPNQLTSVKEVQRLTGREWPIIHIPKEENVEVDTLANLGSSMEMKGFDFRMVFQLLHSVLDIDDGQLYRRSFQGPLAWCLGASEAEYMMREVYEGVCENQFGVDSLVLKLIRAGYYLPQMEQDAKAFVQKCDKCQCHAQLVHQPA